MKTARLICEFRDNAGNECKMLAITLERQDGFILGYSWDYIALPMAK